MTSTGTLVTAMPDTRVPFRSSIILSDRPVPSAHPFLWQGVLGWLVQPDRTCLSVFSSLASFDQDELALPKTDSDPRVVIESNWLPGFLDQPTQHDQWENRT